jgi:nitric oxide reductase activation protein
MATLADVAPTGYTRIGPAIRHGIHLLQQQNAAQKLLLLISDGTNRAMTLFTSLGSSADCRGLK